MPATQTKLRRGTSSQVISMTPAEAEVVVDLSNDRLHLGDGVTAGGIILPNAWDMQTNSFAFITAGGTANAITGTLAPAILSYTQPLSLKVKITNTNTNAVTINLNGLGTRNIYKVAAGALVPLVAGDLIAGMIYEITYDGTQFLLSGSAGGIIVVKQGDLSTSTGSVSLLVNLSAGSTSSTILPGGQYGFYPETSYPNNGGGQVVLGLSAGNTGGGVGEAARLAVLRITTASTNTTFTATQRYVTSSPPFDMGDGEAAGFIFLLVDGNGEVVSHYSADVPPWAYNGPTNITATHQCKKTGKKFCNIMKKRSFEEIMDGAPIEYQLKEITQKMKNADMKIIPHPFGDIPNDHHVVMLDPMDSKIRSIVDYQNAGGTDWVESLFNGKIEIGDACTRCGPKDVHIHKLKYKYSGKF